MHPLIIVFCVFNGFMQSDDRMGTEPVVMDASPQVEIARLIHDSTVTAKGRIFVTNPGKDGDEVLLSLAEILDTGEIVPYPDSEWNRRGLDCDPCTHFRNLQCLAIDGENCLWVFDCGDQALENWVGYGAKLIRINLDEDRVDRVILLDQTDFPTLYDFETMRVDTQNQLVYLMDHNEKVFSVVDLKRAENRTFQGLSRFFGIHPPDSQRWRVMRANLK